MTAENSAYPANVVALGGGTGLPVILEGLRLMVGQDRIQDLTAVVTMSDDGGSSGRLRKDRGLPPPGDVRNCIVALATERELLSKLFQYRYNGGEGLDGHSLGNLILAALSEQTGSFLKAVERSSEVLRTVGRVLPVTLADVVLQAEFEDGRTVTGETEISKAQGKIRRIGVKPASVQPTPGVLEAIRKADLLVFSPGSLYTSLLPHLVIPGMDQALRSTQAVRVMIGNLVSEDGEAADLDLGDHLRVVSEHAGGDVVDVILVNDATVDPPALARYRKQGIRPLYLDPGTPMPVPVVRKDLLAPQGKLRHDPRATAEGVLEAWHRLRHKTAVEERRLMEQIHE